MKKILTHYNGTRFDELQTQSDVGKFLQIPLEKLKSHSLSQAKHYIEDKILKNDGSFRIIYKPKDSLKEIQRNILDCIVSKAEIPECVYGLGKSCAENARMHLRKKYLIRLDIKNFFPTVHSSTITSVFTDLGFGAEAAKLLKALTTCNHQLPQGAPTSNYLSALVLHNVDYRILKLVRPLQLTYTRYFDDINISGHKDVHALQTEVEKIIHQQGFSLNKKKTEYYGPSDTKEVNGIILAGDELAAPKLENEIEEHIDKIIKKKIDPSEIVMMHTHCIGLLAFINDVNKKTHNRLAKKYSEAITSSKNQLS